MRSLLARRATRQLSFSAFAFAMTLFGAPADDPDPQPEPAVAKSELRRVAAAVSNPKPAAWSAPQSYPLDPGRPAAHPDTASTTRLYRAAEANALLSLEIDAADIEAIAHLIAHDENLPHDPLGEQPPVSAELAARSGRLASDAAARRGPYGLVLEVVPVDGGREASVAVSIESASGRLLTGVDVELTATGPVRLESRTEPTGSNGLAEFSAEAIGDGQVRFAANVELPGESVRVRTFDDPAASRIAEKGPAVVITAKADLAMATTFRPSVTSKPRPATTPNDLRATDLIVTAGDGPSWTRGAEITVTSTLYGPFDIEPERATAPPKAAPVAGETTTRVTGPSVHRTKAFPISEPGVYVWRHVAAAGEANRAFAGAFGIPAQFVVVRMTPTLALAASATQLTVDGRVRAELEVAGLPERLAAGEKTVDVELHGPFPSAPEAEDCDEWTRAAIAQPAWGNGEVAAQPFDAIGAPGYYTLVAAFDETPRIAGASTECGAPAATFVVTQAPGPTWPPAPDPEPRPAPDPEPTSRPTPAPGPTDDQDEPPDPDSDPPREIDSDDAKRATSPEPRAPRRPSVTPQSPEPSAPPEPSEKPIDEPDPIATATPVPSATIQSPSPTPSAPVARRPTKDAASGKKDLAATGSEIPGWAFAALAAVFLGTAVALTARRALTPRD